MAAVRRLAGLCVAVVSLLLAGCPAPPPGEQKGGPAPGPGTTSGPTVQAPKTEAGPQGTSAGSTSSWGPADGLAIGSYMSLTGDKATFGQSSNMAMGMAVDEINAKGGVLGGKKLHLAVEDSASTPDGSRNAVSRLLNVQKVFVVIGEVASSNSLAAGPVCQEKKVPMLTPSSTNPKVTQVGDFIFRCCFTDDQQGAYLAKFAQIQGYKRAVILEDTNSDYSKGLTAVIKERFPKGGGQILAVEDYQQKQSDYSATLTKIKGLNPDAIFIPGYYNDVGQIIKQARDLGITAALLGADGWDSPVLAQLAGDYLNQNCYFVNHYFMGEQRPKVQQFVPGFKQRFNEDPDALAACAYDGLYIVADAINRAKSTDPKAVRDAIAATKDFDGVTGKITIDANRNASKPCVVLTFKNGQQALVTSITPEQL